MYYMNMGVIEHPKLRIVVDFMAVVTPKTKKIKTKSFFFYDNDVLRMD